MIKKNKWICAAIPALLLHCSIGTVYCWSIFSQEIADHIGFSKSATEWAFSLAIFFLGLSAAFLGSVVEKDIHRSSLISTICFTLGMLGAALAFGLEWVMYDAMIVKIGEVDALQLFKFVQFEELLIPMVVTFAAAGMFVGIVGSWTSIRKFLNV